MSNTNRNKKVKIDRSKLLPLGSAEVQVKMKRLELQAAPYAYGSMLKAFFTGDDRFIVGKVKEAEDGNYSLDIKVNSECAYCALNKILVGGIEFGGQALWINVIPANKKLEKKLSETKLPEMDDVTAAAVVLKNNPMFDGIRKEIIPILLCEMNYILFKPKVLQYPCDNIGNPWRVCTTTYEEAACSIFTVSNGVFSTTYDKN